MTTGLVREVAVAAGVEAVVRPTSVGIVIDRLTSAAVIAQLRKAAARPRAETETRDRGRHRRVGERMSKKILK